MVKRRKRVRQRLGLDALGRVNDKDSALARGKRTGDLIIEIDVSRRVDQIENISFAVFRLVFEFDGACLDGDAALAFKIHVVEELILHLPRRDGFRHFENTVGKR